MTGHLSLSLFVSLCLGFVKQKVKLIAMDEEAISKLVAMTAILHAPTLILRLPSPLTLNSFMIQRFICAAISFIFSLLMGFWSWVGFLILDGFLILGWWLGLRERSG